VTIVNQRSALAVGALAGAAAAFVLGRRRPRTQIGAEVTADPRAEELRQKLAEARQAGVDEAEFEAAGMGAETIVADEPSRRETPPRDEFEAMRRRVHEEARATADEMRRRAETTEPQ
jgi:membrane-bound lytic murein transglycosylase B